jgi:hypothetical protein
MWRDLFTLKTPKCRFKEYCPIQVFGQFQHKVIVYMVRRNDFLFYFFAGDKKRYEFNWCVHARAPACQSDRLRKNGTPPFRDSPPSLRGRSRKIPTVIRPTTYFFGYSHGSCRQKFFDFVSGSFRRIYTNILLYSYAHHCRSLAYALSALVTIYANDDRASRIGIPRLPDNMYNIILRIILVRLDGGRQDVSYAPACD